MGRMPVRATSRRSTGAAWLVGVWLTPVVLQAASVTGGVELVTGSEANGVKSRDNTGVVVWLEPVQGKAPLPRSRVYTMLQKGKRFTPHVIALPVGGVVDFPNRDPIFHNAFSNFAGQPFDTGLYAPGSTEKVKFTRPGVVRVFCNIHANMSAVIVVLESPWFAVSDRRGEFTIGDVPSGDYTLHVWHERATAKTLAELERRISVAEPGNAAGTIRVSEAGYVVLPHKNKYGKDYGPEPSSKAGYGKTGK